MSNQTRQPAGTPTGGQFAAGTHTEASASITAPRLPDLDSIGPRFEQAIVDEYLENVLVDQERSSLRLIDLPSFDLDDEMAAQEAFGVDRYRWMSGVTAEISPPEEGPDGANLGSVLICDGTGKELAEYEIADIYDGDVTFRRVFYRPGRGISYADDDGIEDVMGHYRPPSTVAGDSGRPAA